MPLFDAFGRPSGGSDYQGRSPDRGTDFDIFRSGKSGTFFRQADLEAVTRV
jgi:hypothetical protein